MKVAELIAKLSELDPSMRVVVNGYESGFDVVNAIRTITVRPWQPSAPGSFGGGDKEKMDCYGELEPCESGEIVVLLPRTSN